MIRAESLTKAYGSVIALEDVSFFVPAGEICALIGPNGAGKSTCLKILGGLLAPDGGRVHIGGFDLSDQPLRAKAKLGFVPERAALYDAVSVHNFLQMVAALHRLPPLQAGDRIRTLLESLRFGDAEDRPLGGCSKGTRQKALIAAALVHSPSVVIMDEPFEGLDLLSVDHLVGILRAMAADGVAILFSTHDLDIAESLATSYMFVRNGLLEAAGAMATGHSDQESPRLRHLFRRSELAHLSRNGD